MARATLSPPLVIHADPGSWVGMHLGVGSGPIASAQVGEVLFDRILRRRDATQDLGAQPLWSGYASAGLDDYPLDVSAGATRSADQLSVPHSIGRLFASVTIEREPGLVVEVGTGFGVSGMYWLAGLELNGSGQLLTFEANPDWAEIARSNLASIGSRFQVVEGAFEDRVEALAASDAAISICFIDAIHTAATVRRQLQIVLSHAAAGALIFLDDIDFSSDMSACWDALKSDEQYCAAAEIGRVGLIELREGAPRH